MDILQYLHLFYSNYHKAISNMQYMYISLVNSCWFITSIAIFAYRSVNNYKFKKNLQYSHLGLHRNMYKTHMT